MKLQDNVLKAYLKNVLFISGTPCGGKLRFQKEQMLDNSPMRDGLFSPTFDVLPAFCEKCGKYEFFNPEVIEKNPYLAHLIKTDTEA